MWAADKEAERSLHPRTILHGTAFAYCPAQQRLFMFGGRSNNPQPRLMAYDVRSTCWEDRGTSMPPRHSRRRDTHRKTDDDDDGDAAAVAVGAPSIIHAGPSLYGHAMVVHNATTLFVHGGKEQTLNTPSGKLYAHHVAIGTWECLDGHVGGCQAPVMVDHAGVKVDDATLVFVGVAEGRKRSRVGQRATGVSVLADTSMGGGQVLSVFQLSLLPQPVWQELAPLPASSASSAPLQPRSRRGFTLLATPDGTSLVLVGGHCGHVILNEVWVFDLKRCQWSQMPQHPYLLSRERAILGASAIVFAAPHTGGGADAAAAGAFHDALPSSCQLLVLDGAEWVQYDLRSGRRQHGPCAFAVKATKKLLFIAAGIVPHTLSSTSDDDAAGADAASAAAPGSGGGELGTNPPPWSADAALAAFFLGGRGPGAGCGPGRSSGISAAHVLVAVTCKGDVCRGSIPRVAPGGAAGAMGILGRSTPTGQRLPIPGPVPLGAPALGPAEVRTAGLASLSSPHGGTPASSPAADVDDDLLDELF